MARDFAAILESHNRENCETEHRAGRECEACPVGRVPCPFDGRIRLLIQPPIDPGTDRRHHPIAQSRCGRNIRGLLGVVAEQTAERGHSLINRILRDRHIRPDLAQQIIDADDFAVVLGKAQEQADCPRL